MVNSSLGNGVIGYFENTQEHFITTRNGRLHKKILLMIVGELDILGKKILIKKLNVSAVKLVPTARMKLVVNGRVNTK